MAEKQIAQWYNVTGGRMAKCLWSSEIIHERGAVDDLALVFIMGAAPRTRHGSF